MKYTKENLPLEFSCFNSAETPIHLKKIEDDLYILSSTEYSDTYKYFINSVLGCLNREKWTKVKVIKEQRKIIGDYEIY